MPMKPPCPHVTPSSSCALIDQQVGTLIGLSEAGCSFCWRHGPTSATSTVWRTKVALTINQSSLGPTLARKAAWEHARPSWSHASSFILALLSRLFFGRLPTPEYHARLSACAFCPNLRITPSGAFCGACGCGENSLARLDHPTRSKLLYPFLRCPAGRFEAAPVPPTLSGRIFGSLVSAALSLEGVLGYLARTYREA